MIIFAIDPGNTESAYVGYEAQTAGLLNFGKIPNDMLLRALRQRTRLQTILVIEQIASFGMPVGAEVFETVYWSGRFAEAFSLVTGMTVSRVKRHQVKMHLCHNMRAKDGNIRQALIDRFGPVGTKKEPGKLYGVSGDVWSALAVAVTYADTALFTNLKDHPCK